MYPTRNRPNPVLPPGRDIRPNRALPAGREGRPPVTTYSAPDPEIVRAVQEENQREYHEGVMAYLMDHPGMTFDQAKQEYGQQLVTIPIGDEEMHRRAFDRMWKHPGMTYDQAVKDVKWGKA